MEETNPKKSIRQQFFDGEILVETNNLDFVALMSFCEKRGFVWEDGRDLFSRIPKEILGSKIYVHVIDFRIAYYTINSKQSKKIPHCTFLDILSNGGDE